VTVSVLAYFFEVACGQRVKFSMYMCVLSHSSLATPGRVLQLFHIFDVGGL